MNEREKINYEIKVLNKTMRKLEKDNLDVWAKSPKWEGYGFKVILDKSYIDVWTLLKYNDADEFFIRKHKKDGNILDTFKDKELAKRTTKDVNEIYDIVLALIKED